MRLVRLGMAIAFGGFASALLPAQPARANCYEIIGCSDKTYFKASDLNKLGCQPLWEVRNWIYKENGYCFKTPGAIETFGNAGCLYDDVTKVPLNEVEKYNVQAIKRVETQKGCS